MNFYWGTSTAAYQIEGGAREDGRGSSIWDTFSHTPGRTVGGDNGDVACDHYHRRSEDVEMMAKLGVNAYRFSVSWPRVQPGGAGPANAKGLAFYDKLVDDLLGHGITPFVTLYHWDLPQELEDAGGWPERDTAYRFAEYAAIVRRAFGDRVDHFITLNEPWCTAFLGYGDGHHAPGRTNGADALAAAHHLNLAHVLSAQALTGKQVGISLNLHQHFGDPEAVRRLDAVGNRIWLDPLFKGAYPDDLLEDTKGVTDWSFVRDGDLATGTLSYLGVNYYTSQLLELGEPQAEPPASTWPGSEHVRMVDRGLPRTEMGWEIDPPAFTRLLKRVHDDYGPIPLFITENGMAAPDTTLDDSDRIAYLDAHFRAFEEAKAQGVPINGYFLWSLMDNFEWSWGYSKRFGIIHVDYESQVRRPKASAHWYAEVIRRGGINDDPAHEVGRAADA
ncbi:MAG TPA: GH1 family beta-glucosidase [Candidatus Limnocylindrales bacterium]